MTLTMTGAMTSALGFEARKLARSSVGRLASLALLVLTTLTTVGGYAAARSAPATDMGRKANELMAAPGWAGYTGLAATSVGITMLLVSGFVMAWVVGREFTDGTIVGLFGIPARPASVATAKTAVLLAWVAATSLVLAAVLTCGGVLLGLPLAGAVGAGATIAMVAFLLGAAATPVMWVATRWRGYLAGIAATLVLVVVSNVSAGFGLANGIPWIAPVLWATPGSGVPAAVLALPVVTTALGAWATCHAWGRLQLGSS